MGVLWDWCIEYANDTRFTSLDGEPDESPLYPRVLLIAQPCARGKHDEVLMNGTWFLYRGDLGYWTVHEREGDALDEHIDHGRDVWATRKGKYVPKSDFNRIRRRINEELGICQPHVGSTT